MTEVLAILKQPRLSVNDRGLVALSFESMMPGCGALQIIYLERLKNSALPEGCAQFTELIRAAGSFDKLDGLPIIVEHDPQGGFALGTYTYLRPANI